MPALMRFVTRLPFFLTGAFLILSSCTLREAQKTPGRSDLIAFVNASLITMTNDKIIPHSAVLVSNGRITQVGIDDDIAIPVHAFRIDCRGQYLAPGLTDMHVHTSQKYQLTLFLANGITSIRNMWGMPLHLSWNSLAETGEIIIPHIYSSGPLTDGPNPIQTGSRIAADPTTARRFVIEDMKDGYNGFKIYSKLSPEVFDEIMKTAEAEGFPVWGHIPYQVPLEHALKSGITSIEHFTGYDLAVTANPARFLSPGTNAWTNFKHEIYAWESANPDKMNRIAVLTKKSGVWNCPTLLVMCEPDKERALIKRYIRYIHPEAKLMLKNNREQSNSWTKSPVIYRKMYDMIRALHKIGAGLLIGTDCNQLIPSGFSLREEAVCFRKAGFTSFEILRIMTHDAAVFLGQDKEFGTIEPGKRADLVLLAANPIKNIRNTGKVQGVMVYGRWLSKRNLDQMLAEIVEQHARYRRSTGQ